MPRFRGPTGEMPAGDAGWAMLNARLFGNNAEGGYDLAPASEVLPLVWGTEFGRTAPLALEIGFNRGKFLTAMQAAWPQTDFVGIEVRRKFVWALANRLGAEDGPRNVRVIWADAKNVVNAIFAPGSLSAIFINFPDPWWKRRHVKRRLVDTTFAAEMAALLAPGGRIYVKSDVLAIAQEIQSALDSVPELSGPTPFEADFLPFTHRETSCVAKGMPITRYWHEKTAPA